MAPGECDEVQSTAGILWAISGLCVKPKVLVGEKGLTDGTDPRTTSLKDVRVVSISRAYPRRRPY